MPRCARVLSDKQFYHIMLRGNNRENIFIDDEDKLRIIDIIKAKKQDGAFDLYAFCVMDNHIHLLIKEGKDSPARIIKRIGTSYAYYFNKKYKRVGHVFQDRYKSENVEDDRYLLTLIRYIHQNPFKAGIGTLEGYKWSSYRDYFSSKESLQEVDEILDLFSTNRQKAIVEFSRFNYELTEETYLDVGIEKEINTGNIKEFINDYLNSKGIAISQLRECQNQQIAKELLAILLNKSNLSLRGIAVELGMNREKVRRMVVST